MFCRTANILEYVDDMVPKKYPKFGIPLLNKRSRHNDNVRSLFHNMGAIELRITTCY
jgi:hypothetical protein